MEVFKPNKKTVEYDKKKLVKGKKVGEGNTAKIFRAGYGFWKGLIRNEKTRGEYDRKRALEGYSFLKSIGARVPNSLRYIKDKGFLVSDLSESGKYNIESGDKQKKEMSKKSNTILKIGNFEDEIESTLNILKKISETNRELTSDAYFVKYLRDHTGEIDINIIIGDIDAMERASQPRDIITQEENLIYFADAVYGWLHKKVQEGSLSVELEGEYRGILKKSVERIFDIDWDYLQE